MFLSTTQGLTRPNRRRAVVIGHAGPMAIRTGTRVRWKWGSSWAEGTVEELRHDDVRRTTKGEQVTRHGTREDPALVMTQDDGTVVLKLEHEVERAT